MGKGAKQEGPVMKGVGHAVAEAAYLSSDVCFLFPVLPDHPFGEELLHMEEAGHKNRHGKPCKVHKLHTYPSALDVTNKAAPGGMVGVVTLSQGLASMAINIRAAVQHRRAMVIHVAGVDVGENFELHSNTRTAYELMDAGAGLVVSANALDCYGAAIYSYMLAQQLQAPVIHLVDGPLALAARSSAALSWDLVASMAESMHRAYVPSSRGGMQMDVGDFHAFAYHGDRAPRSVFVAVGPAVQSAKRAVDSGHGLGLLHVEVLEPWSDQDFLARLPASTEFVVVLDYANAAKALHQRVRRAVAGSAQLRAVGALSVEYETAEDIDSARLLQLAASQGRGQEYGAVALQDIEVLPRSPQAPCHAPGVPAGGGMVGKTLRELSEGRNLHEVAAITENLNSHGVHPAHMEPLRAIFEGGKQYRMWWAQEAERALLPRLCTALGSDGGHVDAASYYDVFRKAGEELAMTDVLVAKVPGQHLNHRICQADMSVVYHAALTEEFDVFASLRDGGVVLINCPVNYLGLHRVVPGDALERGYRVFFLCAAEAARICRIDESLAVSICAVYLSEIENGKSTAHALRGAHAHAEELSTEVLQYLLYTALMPFHIAKCLETGLGRPPGAPKPAQLTSRVLYTGDAAPAQAPLVSMHEEEVVKRCLVASVTPSYQHRPDLPDTIEFHVKKNVRLTSPSYYRDVFHIELEPRDPHHQLNYLPGMVLNIYPKNNPPRVDVLLEGLGVDGQEFVSRRYKTREGVGMEEVNTVRHYLCNVLDIFGCPKPSFYRTLAEYTDNPMAVSLLVTYAEQYESAVDMALTYADVLLLFKDSVQVPSTDLVKGSLIPTIAARSYSIASCPDIVGNQIDLVVVVETWRNKLGAEKEGMSSSYLSRLRELAPAEGRMVTANVVTSTALKITDYTKPCVMIGLGTGIAPFRSFIQKYFYEREKNGIRTGEVVLYFGARTSADEYLYGHELEQYKLWGTVSALRLAFSRDPGQKKTYVQDLLKQDGPNLQRLILQQKGYIMMCGPDWPVPALHRCLDEMGIDVNEMMKEGRYLEEVY